MQQLHEAFKAVLLLFNSSKLSKTPRNLASPPVSVTEHSIEPGISGPPCMLHVNLEIAD